MRQSAAHISKTGNNKVNEKRIPVLIVGGGTVGLYLAMELGWRGVDFIMVSDRDATSTHPKGSTINSRSMEHLRRIGRRRPCARSAFPPIT